MEYPQKAARSGVHTPNLFEFKCRHLNWRMFLMSMILTNMLPAIGNKNDGLCGFYIFLPIPTLSGDKHHLSKLITSINTAVKNS
jgi:hypothetical protein